MLDKKVVELDSDEFGKQYKGEYTFTSIGWAATNRISAECTKVEPASGRTEVDIKQLQAKTLLATLIDKPKIITLNHLLDESSAGLPPMLGELLMAVADEVNGYSAKGRERLKKLKGQWDLE